MSDLTHWHLSQRLTDHCCGPDCGEKLLRPADCCHRDWGPGPGLPLSQSCGGEIPASISSWQIVTLMMQKLPGSHSSIRDTGKYAAWMASYKLKSVEIISIPLHSTGKVLGTAGILWGWEAFFSNEVHERIMAQEGKLHNCSIFVFIDLRGSWIRIIVSELSIGG